MGNTTTTAGTSVFYKTDNPQAQQLVGVFFFLLKQIDDPNLRDSLMLYAQGEPLVGETKDTSCHDIARAWITNKCNWRDKAEYAAGYTARVVATSIREGFISDFKAWAGDAYRRVCITGHPGPDYADQVIKYDFGMSISYSEKYHTYLTTYPNGKVDAMPEPLAEAFAKHGGGHRIYHISY